MIAIAKMGAHSVAYYESTVEGEPGADSYYSEDGASPGRAWVVASTRESFAEVSERLGVVSGEFLRGRAVHKWFNKAVAPGGETWGSVPGEKGVPGFDLTFCAPKSVSVLWGFSDDSIRSIIDRAHAQAVAAGLESLRAHAGYTRRQDPTVKEKRLIIEKIPALSGVRYEHRTSRAGDPHIHSHVLLANRQVCKDGKVRTLDGVSLYHSARGASMIYQATLRRVLSEDLGVEWGARVDGCADIAGLDDRALINSFSQRHTEIDQWQQANGLATRSMRSVAQKITRRKKDLSVSITDLRNQWQRNPFAEVVNGVIDDLVTGQRIAIAPADIPTAEEILSAVVEERSTFTRADVMEKAAELLPVGAVESGKIIETVERLTTQALESRQAWAVTPDKAREVDNTRREGALRFTAETVVHEVDRAISLATEVTSQGVDASTIVPVEGALSQEQADAMRAVCQSRYLASVVIAPAGAGKTSSLKAAREVWENAGKTVVGLAPTGKAADVMVSEQVAHESMTVARALKGGQDYPPEQRAQLMGWNRNTVVVVDESGMVATPDMVTILETASAAGARVVLVGDPCQYSAVKARSGLLATLAHELPDAVELTEVFRQRDEQEREVSKWLRSGEEPLTERAAQWYADNGRLHAGSVTAMLEDALAGWEKDTRAGKKSLLVAATGQQVHALNAAAQKIRAQRGELNMDAYASLSDGLDAYEGDTILTRRNDYSLTTTNGEVVRNGQRWIVQEVTDTGAVVAASDQDPTVTVTLPTSYLREHTQLGYASTGHSAQGATVDIARVVAGVGNLDRASVYVPMTRGREGNYLYIAEKQPGDSDTGHGSAEPKQRRESADYARDILASAASRVRGDSTPQTLYGTARTDWELSQLIDGRHRDPFAGTEIEKFMQRSEQRRAQRFAEYLHPVTPEQPEQAAQPERVEITRADVDARKRAADIARDHLASAEQRLASAHKRAQYLAQRIAGLNTAFSQLGKFSQWRGQKAHNEQLETLSQQHEQQITRCKELEESTQQLREQVTRAENDYATARKQLDQAEHYVSRPGLATGILDSIGLFPGKSTHTTRTLEDMSPEERIMAQINQDPQNTHAPTWNIEQENDEGLEL